MNVGPGSVIGIDLSGLSHGTKGRTVAAHLVLDDRARLVELKSIRRGLRGDVDLLTWIEACSPTAVGIDAPLSLPHSVTCHLEACERCAPGRSWYLSRDVDRLVSGMPTVMLAAIAFRAIFLARRLRASGVEVIEVYPRIAFERWQVPRGDRSAQAAYLTSRVGSFSWTIGDELDAIAAALVTADYASGTGDAVAGRDGSISLPQLDA